MLEESHRWLERHAVDRRYVPVSELNRAPDCGATASWIPTLLRIGEHAMAKNFAEYLMTMQRPDGSYAQDDTPDRRAFVTGQIIRGWAAIAARQPEVREPMRHACEWMLSVSDPGTAKFTATTPDATWSVGKRGEFHEGVHLYVVQPMRDAAAILDAPHFREAADRALRTYLATLDVSHFDRPNVLSHCYGYIQEALMETGHRDLAIAGMNSVAQFQRPEGSVPAYYDVSWVCTPGLMQLAKVWLMLGDNPRAQAALGFVRQLQNYTGGFYGSYGPSAAYFPATEVSSAPKFAIDAEVLELESRGLASRHAPLSALDIGRGTAMGPTPPSARRALASAPYPVKVSIVLPTYNHARYLAEALRSIFDQTFVDYELIIVDDGSTDDTADMLRGITHPNLRVITQVNQGTAAALNAGFAHAKGEYWTWTSADNVVGPTWLEELVKALDESPVEVGYALSSYAHINEVGQMTFINDRQCFEAHDLMLRCGNASFLYRSQVAREAGIYDPTLKPAEDLDMWLRMSVLTRAVHVESVLYYYRLHEDQMSSKVPDAIVRSTIGANVKFVASSGGAIDVDRIFPSIAQNADPSIARWQAKVWLAVRLAQSPFWPIDPVVDLLVSALLDRYDQGLVGNIVILAARHDEWTAAATVVSSFMQEHPSPFLRDLAGIIARRDKQALGKMPLLTIADGALSFSVRSQLSRAHLFKMAGWQRPSAIEIPP